MSEPNSFFLRVKIKRENFDAFMNASPTAPKITENWTAWWESRKMVSKRDIDEHFYAIDAENNRSIVGIWPEGFDTFARSDYSDETEEWIFSILMCTQNFGELTPLLVFVESLTPYIEHSPDNFAIVYPYFWGDSGVMVYVTWIDGVVSFSPHIANTSQISQDKLDFMAACFAKVELPEE